MSIMLAPPDGVALGDAEALLGRACDRARRLHFAACVALAHSDRTLASAVLSFEDEVPSLAGRLERSLGPASDVDPAASTALALRLAAAEACGVADLACALARLARAPLGRPDELFAEGFLDLATRVDELLVLAPTSLLRRDVESAELAAGLHGSIRRAARALAAVGAADGTRADVRAAALATLERSARHALSIAEIARALVTGEPRAFLGLSLPARVGGALSA